jgi:hypothetical protein
MSCSLKLINLTYQLYYNIFLKRRISPRYFCFSVGPRPHADHHFGIWDGWRLLCWLIMSLPTQGRRVRRASTTAPATAPRPAGAAPAARARPSGHHDHALDRGRVASSPIMRAGGTSVYDDPSTYLPTGRGRGCVHHSGCTVYASDLSWTQLASHGLTAQTLTLMMIMIAPATVLMCHCRNLMRMRL